MSSSLRQLKYQTDSVTTINRCALNNSPSKRLISFAKANRFPKQHSQPIITNKSKTEAYSEPSKKPVLFPTIPRANRIFYFPLEKELGRNPSPLDYNVTYQDQMCKINHKGDTMGAKLSRSTSKDILPGPSYVGGNLTKKSFNKTSTFHRSTRNLNQFLNTRGQDSPGPKYQLKHAQFFKKSDSKEKLRRQRFKTKNMQKAKNLIVQKVNRFQTKLLQNQLVANKQVLSSQRTAVKPKKVNNSKIMSKSFRQTVFSAPSHSSQSPGPADYVFFSQFSGWR